MLWHMDGITHFSCQEYRSHFLIGCKFLLVDRFQLNPFVRNGFVWAFIGWDVHISHHSAWVWFLVPAPDSNFLSIKTLEVVLDRSSHWVLALLLRKPELSSCFLVVALAECPSLQVSGDWTSGLEISLYLSHTHTFYFYWVVQNWNKDHFTLKSHSSI